MFIRSCLELLLEQIGLLAASETLTTNCFGRLLVADSTQWQVHSALKRWYKGSGGSASKAACKLQTIIEPRSGKLLLMDYGKATRPDQGYSKNIPKLLLAGDLILFDLGYYCVKVFRRIQHRKAFFIIPIYYNAIVRKEFNSASCSVASFLSKVNNEIQDCQLMIGSSEHMNVRLVATKISLQKANAHRRKLREDYRRQRSGQPTEQRLQFCDWTVLITNVPCSQLNTKQVVDLYRTRWQIEIFFRDVKSLLKLDCCKTSNKERFQAQLLAILFVAALLFFVSGRFNKMLHPIHQESSLDKLFKRFGEFASSFSGLILQQSNSSLRQAAQLLLRFNRNAIKFHQPTRETPLQLMKSCGLS